MFLKKGGEKIHYEGNPSVGINLKISYVSQATSHDDFVIHFWRFCSKQIEKSSAIIPPMNKDVFYLFFSFGGELRYGLEKTENNEQK